LHLFARYLFFKSEIVMARVVQVWRPHTDWMSLVLPVRDGESSATALDQYLKFVENSEVFRSTYRLMNGEN